MKQYKFIFPSSEYIWKKSLQGEPELHWTAVFDPGSFEICYLPTWVHSWWLTARLGKEHTVEYFYWDSMCDHRMSLGVRSDNFRCYFFQFQVNSGAALRDATLTQKSGTGRKKNCSFIFSFFHLNMWKGRRKLVLYKQPTARGPHFANHLACWIYGTFSCADFCSRRTQGCWQSPEVICEQWGAGVWPQRLPGLVWAWQDSQEWRQLLLKLCFLKACQSPDAVLMETENYGEWDGCVTTRNGLVLYL